MAPAASGPTAGPARQSQSSRPNMLPPNSRPRAWLPRSPPGCASRALLHRLDVRALDDLAEVSELLTPEAIELLRARPNADDADVAIATNHLGALHRFPGFRSDPFHDVRRSVRRGEDRGPERDRVARQRVGDRRYRGKHWRTLGRGDGERTHLAALNVAELSRRTVEHDRDASGKEVGHDRRIAPVRHMHHVDAGHRLEQLASEVRHRPHARGAIAVLSGI